jgi:hypothetical protein
MAARMSFFTGSSPNSGAGEAASNSKWASIVAGLYRKPHEIVAACRKPASAVQVAGGGHDP